MQAYKTVYFPDETASCGSGLTLAFGSDDKELFDRVTQLSSLRIRELIGVGSFGELESIAAKNGIAVSTFCRDALNNALEHSPASATHFSDFLQATFAGGKDQPLQSWYPYLEGYSPDFVNEIVERYCPDARDVVDPFAGSGTTPLTIMARGGSGAYIDVNPLCRFLIATKAGVLAASSSERRLLSKQLRRFGSDFEGGLKKAKPDSALTTAYERSFGSSEFFSATAFDQILRARTVIDEISAPVLQQLCLVAAIRSLIPASKLIRRGDLRFKNSKELLRPSPSFVEAMQASCEIIAAGLEGLESPSGRIVDCGTTALAPKYDRTFDAAITSPPYLNGTNYFRNTKVELWFARLLRDKADLRNFRHEALTAGICDVTRGKSSARAGQVDSDLLRLTLEKVSSSAYDPRIPAMVETYFSDLQRVLQHLVPAIKDGGTIAIDIGDSEYGGVHVPTDTLICELLNGLGAVQVDDVTLRERASRGGGKLRQTLLVFRKRQAKSSRLPQGWDAFKTDLPHQRAPMSARNWGSPLHSLCSYQGKLKPSIAHSLVEAFVPKGGTILDPFAGVGTIPFEACLTGRVGLAMDISASAFSITKAKLSRCDARTVRRVMRELEDFISGFKMSAQEKSEAKSFGFNGKLVEFFHKETLKEIYGARHYFAEAGVTSASRALVHACLQHILHGNRPYALSRRSHPITPYAPTGDYIYKNLVEHLRDKVERSLAVDRGTEFISGKVFLADSTAPWPKEISNIDAIITSPPFFDSTRFHTANWMRLWFSGWSAEDFRSKPAEFVDERQKKTFDVYDAIFENALRTLKPSGVIVFHVGKSRKCDMASAITKVAQKHFRVLDHFSESVAHCESHGIRDKGTTTDHEYVVFGN